MRTLRTLPVFALATILAYAAAAHAQAFTPAVRIVNPVDENNLTALKGNTHPLARAKNDRGRVSSSLPMTDLVLLLSRGADQQTAFDKFVAGQYDPHSPDFHHWLTPDEVGRNFGPSQTDIQTVMTWLTHHGFTVDGITKDHTRIRFSGNAGQVESAFHTEIHNLQVGSEAHIANMSDPQIPAALAPAVVGIKSLHNFFPRPMHKAGGLVQFNSSLGKWQRITRGNESPQNAAKLPSSLHPEFGTTVGTGGTAYTEEDVAPYDFATIYNVLPLWKASTPIDGTGQKIAIAGTSNITTGDVTTFRKTFGLPAYTSSNAPKVVIANGTDPGACTTGESSCDSDLTENTLDVEWAGAVAPGAQITLVTAGANSTTTDTLQAAEDYIVQNNTAPVMNVSYGECELFLGTTENALYNTMWQQAASEGIAVFVASGDSGAALCDDGQDSQFGTPWAAQYGLSVNGLGSTPYNTAVGGTDLNWGATSATASNFWTATNNTTTGASAKGYIPEIPWNDTCSNPLPLILETLEDDASSVKYTGSVTDPETACDFVATDSISIFQNYTDTNGNQFNISGFVDTVGGGGGASTCSTNTTTITSNNETIGSCTNGYSKPSWQTALTPADGHRDLPDVSFFASNGFLGSAYLVCVSVNGACVTSTSPTAIPYAQEIGGTSVASPAMAGVMALINQKAGAGQGSPNVKLYALAGAETYSLCSSESVSAGCMFNDIDTGTISMPCDYGATNGGILYDSAGVPEFEQSLEQAGIKSPNCTPTHSGDTVGLLPGVDAVAGYDLSTGLGSLNVANVVNAYTSTVVTPTFSIFGNGYSGPIIGGVATSNNSEIFVYPQNGFSGTVNLSCAVTSTPSGASSPLTCSLPTSSVSLTGTSPANAELDTATTATTSSGTYVLTITGTSGSLTETTTISLDVEVPAVTAITVAQSSPTASVAAGTPAVTTLNISGTGGYTGTVTFTCTMTNGPANATADTPSCNFNPTLAVTATAAPVTFTVLTVKPVAASELVKPELGGSSLTGAGGGAVLALLIFFGIPARRRKWLSMVGIFIAMAALGGLVACGGGGSGSGVTKTPANPGTAAGVYTYAISTTGTPVPTTPPASVTFTVTVTN